MHFSYGRVTVHTHTYTHIGHGRVTDMAPFTATRPTIAIADAFKFDHMYTTQAYMVCRVYVCDTISKGVTSTITWKPFLP